MQPGAQQLVWTTADLSSHGITTSSVTVKFDSYGPAGALSRECTRLHHGPRRSRQVCQPSALTAAAVAAAAAAAVAAAAPPPPKWSAAVTLAATATVAATVAATLAATSVAATVATSSVAAAVAAAFPKHLGIMPGSTCNSAKSDGTYDLFRGYGQAGIDFRTCFSGCTCGYGTNLCGCGTNQAITIHGLRFGTQEFMGVRFKSTQQFLMRLIIIDSGYVHIDTNTGPFDSEWPTTRKNALQVEVGLNTVYFSSLEESVIYLDPAAGGVMPSSFDVAPRLAFIRMT